MEKQTKSKIQNVKFAHVDEFWDFLPADEKRISIRLKKLVMDCLPQAKESLSFNVLYYKGNKMICFIWPSSILWGRHKTYEGVRFGLAYGNLVWDEHNFWDKGNRKQVVWKDFRHEKDIPMEELKFFLFQALEVDKEWKRKKQGKS